MADIRPGVRVNGRYRLDDILGSGAMGRVWAAHDETLRRKVVVKEIIFKAGFSDAFKREVCERMRREAQLPLRVRHKGIVEVYDYTEWSGQPWVVMEYLDGNSLQAYLKEKGSLSVSETVQIGLQLIGALDAAHKAGIVHRDIKPANIMLASRGAVLVDFGIAWGNEEATLTVTGEALGTPAYMAPEAVEGRSGVGPEADIWSLGATLYTMVEGRSPYNRPTTAAILGALLTQQPDSPVNAGPLGPLLLGMLCKDKHRRLRADEVTEALTCLAAGETASIRSTYDTQVTMSSGQIAGKRIAGALTFCVIAGSITWNYINGQSPRSPVPTATATVNAVSDLPRQIIRGVDYTLTPAAAGNVYKDSMLTATLPKAWTPAVGFRSGGVRFATGDGLWMDVVKRTSSGDLAADVADAYSNQQNGRKNYQDIAKPAPLGQNITGPQSWTFSYTDESGQTEFTNQTAVIVSGANLFVANLSSTQGPDKLASHQQEYLAFLETLRTA